MAAPALSNWLSLSGRRSRLSFFFAFITTYLIFFISFCVALILLFIAFVAEDAKSPLEDWFRVELILNATPWPWIALMALLALLFLLVHLVLIAQRARDLGLPSWLAAAVITAAMFMPYANWPYFAAVLLLCILPGRKWENRNGPDPLADPVIRVD